MKFAEIVIEPLSAFSTPLKGDTVFGHFCWAVVNDPSLYNGGIEGIIDDCRPFTAVSTNREPVSAKPAYPVFSSMWPTGMVGGKKCYALVRPFVPPSARTREPDRIKALQNRKSEKKKRWILVKGPLEIDFSTPEKAWFAEDEEVISQMGFLNSSGFHINDDEASEVSKPFIRSHNSINRLTGTTGKGFDPFTVDEIWYAPGIRLACFAAFDPGRTDLDSIVRAFSNIGAFGYGKDASTGKGRFRVVSQELIDDPLEKYAGTAIENEDLALMSLGPVVPEAGKYEKVYMNPFTRYGKHGDADALSGSPFKTPVVMADEGALLIPAPFPGGIHGSIAGRPVAGVSKARAETICQGSSIVIPVRLPSGKEALK